MPATGRTTRVSLAMPLRWPTQLLASPANFARRLAPDGTIIADLELEASPSFFVDRMCLNSDERSFWVWNHYDPDFRTSRFSLYSMTGELLRSLEQPQAPAGRVYVDPPVVNPPTWGHANSCPILVLRQSESAVITDTSIPCCPPAKPKTKFGKQRNLSGSTPTGSPATRAPRGATGPITRPDLPIGEVNVLAPQTWSAECAGGGCVHGIDPAPRPAIDANVFD